MVTAAFQRLHEILVVEDSATDTKMILRALGQGPRRKNVGVAVDGEQALARLLDPAQPRPDLVLLDLNLPKKDGWELLAQCKGHPDLRAIPVVVFTTSALDKDVRRCYELGANSFVVKPFDLEPFVEAVRSIEGYWLGLSEPDRGR